MAPNGTVTSASTPGGDCAGVGTFRRRCQSGDDCYYERYGPDEDGSIDAADIMLAVTHWGDTWE